MTRDSVLARGRAAALAGMTDTCVIERDAVAVLNMQTGRQTVSTATVYSGPCRLQQDIAAVRTTTAGGADQLMQRGELQLPVDAASAAVIVGDRVRITASARDPELVDRVVRIRELPLKSEATARRFGVEEVT